MHDFAYFYNKAIRKVIHLQIEKIVTKKGDFLPEETFFNTTDADKYKDKMIDVEVKKQESLIVQAKNKIIQFRARR